MRGTPLSPIGGGLNESVAPEQQTQGSYQQGENVRGIDPRTGRAVWGAQRAGLADEGEVEGSFPTHFATTADLVEAREFTSLTDEPDTSATPQQVGDAWSADIGERGLAVATGPLDGQAYVLGRSGDVVVLNARGEEQETIPSATPSGFNTVPQIAIDEQGAVYTAATRVDRFEGGAGRVYRWLRDEEGIWSTAWEATIQGPISHFEYRAGAMYVAEEGLSLEGDVELIPALTRISNPLLGPQIGFRQPQISSPIFDIAINQRGQAIVSTPARSARGPGDTSGFGLRSVDAIPNQLPAFALNAWAWLDAFNVNNGGTPPQDGEPVTLMLDRRFEPSSFDPISEESPERTLMAVPPAVQIFTPPVWDSSAFAGAGGVRFSGLSALISGLSESDTDPELQRTIIPGLGQDFTFLMLVQFTPEQLGATDARRLFGQEQDDGTSMNLRLSTVLPGGDVQLTERNSGVGGPVGSASALTRTSLIAIESNGSQIRHFVNGELVGQISGAATTQGGSLGIDEGVFSVLGAGRPNRHNLLRFPAPGAEVRTGTSSNVTSPGLSLIHI